MDALELASPVLFLSTLSLRRATPPSAILSNGRGYFYPRSPCGERPLTSAVIVSARLISIHALLAESDGGFGVGSWPRVIFLSTLSLRRATLCSCGGASARPLISIHALLAESDICVCWTAPSRLLFLSTLSLRRATRTLRQLQFALRISIHALLAESDREPTALRTPHQRFLSTLSLRRATSGTARHT